MPKTILRWIPMGILVLLVLTVLELNKNSLCGWAVTILLFGLYIFLYVRFLGEKPFGFKLLAFLGLLVLTFGAFMLSWPPTKAVPAVSSGSALVCQIQLHLAYYSGGYQDV